jgi:hypothetical protein
MLSDEMLQNQDLNKQMVTWQELSFCQGAGGLEIHLLYATAPLYPQILNVQCVCQPVPQEWGGMSSPAPDPVTGLGHTGSKAITLDMRMSLNRFYRHGV